MEILGSNKRHNALECYTERLHHEEECVSRVPSRDSTSRHVLTWKKKLIGDAARNKRASSGELAESFALVRAKFVRSLDTFNRPTIIKRIGLRSSNRSVRLSVNIAFNVDLRQTSRKLSRRGLLWSRVKRSAR